MEKKRSQNWTEPERMSAVEIILQHADILFGKFKGATSGAKEKERKWEDIAAELNSMGKTNVKRTVGELKKMFTNGKARAKEKHASNKKTGGGQNAPLSQTEKIIIDYLMDRPQLEGVVGGMESCKPSCTNPGVDDENGENNGDSGDENSDPIIEVKERLPQPGTTPSCSGTGGQKSSKRQRQDEEGSLYTLEKKRLHLEIKLLQQKLEQEKELFLLKKQILKTQIQRTLEDQPLELFNIEL